MVCSEVFLWAVGSQSSVAPLGRTCTYFFVSKRTSITSDILRLLVQSVSSRCSRLKHGNRSRAFVVYLGSYPTRAQMESSVIYINVVAHWRTNRMLQNECCSLPSPSLSLDFCCAYRLEFPNRTIRNGFDPDLAPTRRGIYHRTNPAFASTTTTTYVTTTGL